MAYPLDKIRDMHAQSMLASGSSGCLLDAGDGMLEYLVSVLRREKPSGLPRASLDEWEHFSLLLAPHYILPYLYPWVYSLPASLQPPGGIMDRMRAAYLSSRARALAAGVQIAGARAAMDRKAVRMLVLKGYATGKTAYPDPGLRPFGDIDLLVFPEDAKRAGLVLESLGYGRATDNLRLLPDLQYSESYLARNGGKLPFELHWHIHSFPRIRGMVQMEKVFRRSAGGFLHPADALVHSSLHMAMKHCREIKLAWVLDIAMLAGKLESAVDWEEMKKAAVSWEVRPAVEHSLELARLWFGLRIPAAADGFLSGPALSRGERKTWKHSRNRTESALSKIYIRGRLSPGLLWRFVFPPREVMRRRFKRSGPALAACYTRRWLMVFGRGSRPSRG